MLCYSNMEQIKTGTTNIENYCEFGKFLRYTNCCKTKYLQKIYGVSGVIGYKSWGRKLQFFDRQL